MAADSKGNLYTAEIVNNRARSDSCWRKSKCDVSLLMCACAGRDRDEPERSVALPSCGRTRPVPRIGKPDLDARRRAFPTAKSISPDSGRAASRRAAGWRSDGSEPQSHDRSSACGFREHRTKLQRRTAVHTVGRRAPEAAHGEQLEGQSRTRTAFHSDSCSSIRTRSRGRWCRP
jgi:hypothetical protein